MKRRRNRPEQELQIAVMRYLDLVLPKEAIAFHVPNGGGRSKAEAGIFKAMGVKAGVPDILIFYNRRCRAIELKAPGKEITQAQSDMAQRFLEAGVSWQVATNLEIIERFLREWEIPLRGKISGGRMASSTDESFPHQRAGRGE